MEAFFQSTKSSSGPSKKSRGLGTDAVPSHRVANRGTRPYDRQASTSSHVNWPASELDVKAKVVVPEPYSDRRKAITHKVLTTLASPDNPIVGLSKSANTPYSAHKSK